MHFLYLDKNQDKNTKITTKNKLVGLESLFMNALR